MPRSPDDDRTVARAARSGSSTTRALVLGGGFALAVAATLAVFLTDNPRYLRIAVVAVAWAFVLATVAAGRRTGDRAAAEMRESELRHAYELELEREVAAHREHELALENELRRETEDSTRDELDALRRDIAKLSGLREEVARVSALGGDLAALTDLRDQVARVAAMRDDVAGLASLRQELGQLAELRADMGRLRAELTEQLSSEMLVERIVMRTQAGRLSDDLPPRELTGGWPAIRLDEPRETQPAPTWQPPSWEPRVRDIPSWERPSWETAFPEPEPEEAPRTGWTSAPLPPLATPASPGTEIFPAAPLPPGAASPLPSRPSADRWSPAPEPDLSPRRPRHSDDEPAPATAAFPVASPPGRPEPPPGRRRHDEPTPASVLPNEYAPTAQRPAVNGRPSPTPRPTPRATPPVPGSAPTGPSTVARPEFDRSAFRFAGGGEAPAEGGSGPATGSRRRRRYRDDDDSDDVLARVLRGQ